MIRLTGLVNLKPVNSPLKTEKLDPVGHEDKDIDNDGDVDTSDKYLKNRRDTIAKNIKEDVMDNGEEVVDDHEGSMAKAQLLSIHKNSSAIYNMVGEDEELEGWVQAKLTKAAEYLDAVFNNMQYEKSKPASIGNGEGTPADGSMPTMENTINEKSPEGWEKTTEKMKKHKEIDNPFALAYYMKKKGYKPHNGK